MCPIFILGPTARARGPEVTFCAHLKGYLLEGFESVCHVAVGSRWVKGSEMLGKGMNAGYQRAIKKRLEGL